MIGLLFTSWQLSISVNPSTIDSSYSIKNTVGGGGHHLEGFKVFAKGFKETGLYPLNPETLEMEVYDTYRMGDRGKMFLLWFDSLFKQDNWSYNRANAILFIGALLVFFYSFYLKNYKIFAVVSAILIGSSSFQLYETYMNNNIFSIAISTTLLTMGLNAFAFKNESERLKFFHCLSALTTGLLLGFIKHIRTEPVIICISVIALYLLINRLTLKSRLLLVLCLIVGYSCSNFSTTYYLDRLHDKTSDYVSKNGGDVYEGHRRNSHLLWHSIYCGYGDYASALDYRWDDYSAFAYALSVLRKNDPHIWPEFDKHLKQKQLSDYFINSDRKYKIKLEDRDDYESILKEKIFDDIASHPGLFINLYLKRVFNSLVHTSGVQLYLPKLAKIDLNFYGFGFISILAALIAILKRDSFAIKMLLFTIPLLSTSLLIYSKNSYEFYSIYPTIGFSIILVYIFDHIFNKKLYKTIKISKIISVVPKDGGNTRDKPC